MRMPTARREGRTEYDAKRREGAGLLCAATTHTKALRIPPLPACDQGRSAGSTQSALTHEHDGSVHDGAPLAANPVSDEADEELAGDDARHLGVGQRVCQVGGAHFVRLEAPAQREHWGKLALRSATAPLAGGRGSSGLLTLGTLPSRCSSGCPQRTRSRPRRTCLVRGSRQGNSHRATSAALAVAACTDRMRRQAASRHGSIAHPCRESTRTSTR